jgi:hypothetical protein
LGGFGNLFGLVGNKRTGLGDLFFKKTSAQTSGFWSIVGSTTVVAIHAALLNSGKILYISGSGYNPALQNGPFSARVLDPSSGSEKNLETTEDIFCLGFTHLENGNVLIAGGTLRYDTNIENCNGRWHGLDAGYEFDVNSEEFVKVSSMVHGRWYPTCVTLPDGKVLVKGGLDEYGTYNRLVEIYDPVSKSFSIKFDPNGSLTYCVGSPADPACPGSGSPCYGAANNGVAPNLGLYPRMHLMPSGLVVTCGFQTGVRSWDPATGIWRFLTNTSTFRSYGTSFLLPLQNNSTERGKILVVGGSPTADSTSIRSAEIIDYNASSSTIPTVRQVPPITNARRTTNPVILPNGKLVIFGGSIQGLNQPVYIPEMFDPVTEVWQLLPAASVPRVYHGVALLLPDGRIWTSGSTPSAGAMELRIEIFSPDYISEATRPTISGNPIVGDYGGTIVIRHPMVLTSVLFP